MPISLPQRQRQDVFYSPSGHQSEYNLFHTTRVIKYVFLDGSQNVVPSSHASPCFESKAGYLDSTKGYYYPFVMPDHHSLASCYWAPDLERLPNFITLSKSQEKSSGGWGRPLFSRDRLPIFRQLCGEAATAASHSRDDMMGPKTAKGEPEKPGKAEAQGLGKQLEGKEEEEEEEKEEKEELAESSVPQMASKERRAKL